MFQCSVLVLLTVSLSIFQVSSEKILFLTPVTFRSESHLFQALTQGLADRGHEITVITSAGSPSPLPPNVTELVPVSVETLIGVIGNVFELRAKGRLETWSSMDVDAMLTLSRRTYDNTKFQEAIKRHYDLIIMNGMGNEAFLGVVHKIGAPFIMMTTMSSPSALMEATGNYLPSASVPNAMWDFPDKMTFLERLCNFLIDVAMDLAQRYILYPKYEEIYRKHLGQDVPDVDAILGNVSLIFTNTHPTLNGPRPILPDTVEIGGLHCKPPKPLPKDLEKFVEEGKDGFIFFSLGTIAKTSEMPEELRKVFVNVFGRLKQRVLWKSDVETMEDLPSNVKLVKWAPQQDILGHSKIRLFMTHGGLLSTQEAAYHGVPLLGFPLFVDQDLNIMRATAQGFALTMEIQNMTESYLEGGLRTVLTDPRFANRAKELSRIVQDQLETPLERAVYWSEYVMRHKGTKHLRSSARDLNYFQAQSYDVIGLLLAILVTAGFLLKWTVVKILRCCFHFITSSPQKRRIVVIKKTN